MILTSIGEIGVTAGDQQYKLRPSLYAMTKLGEPSEIVRVYASVVSDVPHQEQFSDALAVIHACSDEDLSEVFGCFVPARAGKGFRFKRGKAQPEHIIPIAQCLLQHGITGALEPLPRRADDEPEYVQEFDARAHVSLAIAHLGMSSQDAWNMTMTELVGALRAKFPPSEKDSPGAKAPSKSEMEEALEWHDRVLAARSENS